MAIITLTVVRIIMNSSYVLINTTPFVRPPKADGITLPVAWVSILLSMCHSSCRTSRSLFGLGRFSSLGTNCAGANGQGQMALNNHAQMGLVAPDRSGPRCRLGWGESSPVGDFAFWGEYYSISFLLLFRKSAKFFISVNSDSENSELSK